ncbi:meprin A subunit beta-like [Pelobates fuscus]|uniref:meprin A subunit beta-like n=1 Tax=Pelobates fuscus TaxID=191477 RepID=UPI002FE4E8F1
MTVFLFLVFLPLSQALPFPGGVESNRTLEKPLGINDINTAFGLDLFEGDIKNDVKMDRNSIRGDQYRWPLTVPYYLEDSLEMNARGVILHAFERYRLKTCIDFKPWEWENNYISVFRDNGCYSYIGNRRLGKQILSIGTSCDTVEIVQHELFHALGFFHEQSRSDRDDYVTIMREEILDGKENNFVSYTDSVSDSLNAPYDYTSLMHYRKTDFQKGSNPTIITKNPQFSNIIGGQMDLSEIDVLKLNRLYNCTTPLTFMDSCTFDFDDICGALQSSDNGSSWQRLTSVLGGPTSDHTYLNDVKGYFMHFSTSTGNPGDKAILKSRLFYPKRGFQCLEFFYYNSGNESDHLEIWIEEYTSSSNSKLRFISSITGPPANYWQLHHSALNATQKFRYVFYGIKGNASSTGGFSIDDINLSETECPENVWHIRNFNINLTKAGILSPPYYSKDGYAFQIQLQERSVPQLPFNLAVYLHLISGANDNHLQWPCAWRQATIEFMDQNPDITQRTSNAKSVTTDPNVQSGNMYYWDNPAIVGQEKTFLNGTKYNQTQGLGMYFFTVEEWFYRRDFLKGRDAFIFISMKDISNLLKPQPTAPPTVSTPQCSANMCMNDGVCVMENMKPVCRCKTYGEFWYVGERCEKKVASNSNGGMSSSIALCVSMVMFILANDI